MKLPDRTAEAKEGVMDSGNESGVECRGLASVGRGAVREFFNRSMRILEADRDVLQYSCEEFKNRV